MTPETRGKNALGDRVPPRPGWSAISERAPSETDHAVLDRLRAIFLADQKPRGDYWQSASDLANYDSTFGERIGWKWDAVLRGLRTSGWRPPADTVLDWGCGSGVAGRRVRDCFGLARLQVFDRSHLAMEYAVEAGGAERWRDDGGSVGVLVVSHVLNELADRDRQTLLALARRAAAVLWVEPGTHADSRALIAVREELRRDFRVVAPCPHQAACGMLVPENDRHWCHFFADPPANIMADPDWVRLANRVGIDLRRLPYSYLALDRAMNSAQPRPPRMIGEPRIYKPYARLLECATEGVREVEVRKRDEPKKFMALKKGKPETA